MFLVNLEQPARALIVVHLPLCVKLLRAMSYAQFLVRPRPISEVWTQILMTYVEVLANLATSKDNFKAFIHEHLISKQAA